MREELISLELSDLAQSKGFKRHEVQEDIKIPLGDIIDAGTSDNEYSYTPGVTLSFLQKWLRETHEVYVESLVKLHDIGNDIVIAYRYQVKEIRNFELVQVWADDNFPTYEKALEAGLLQALNSLP